MLLTITPLNFENYGEISSALSKLNFLQTLEVVRSDIVKTVKYDQLKKEILKMFDELIIEDFGVPKQCYVYVFVGDHVFLNSLCHKWNQLVSVKNSDGANNPLFSRNNSESFAGYIVYAVMQKLILFNKDFVPYNVISLDLLSLEQKICEVNYTDKNTQSIKSLIKDGSLKVLNCKRFESLNAKIKQLFNLSKNRRNSCSTIMSKLKRASYQTGRTGNGERRDGPSGSEEVAEKSFQFTRRSRSKRCELLRVKDKKQRQKMAKHQKNARNAEAKNDFKTPNE
ncbi:Hypothetical protein SRAE_X000231850 [Strongyloides ratti]|uniref:Uncharacterized protein n=1 Tax=Strongyloides ratti TaxID=34506 RepID=A0A090MQY3_STRRB|nr:Hypothetical protein SRAE_X000231850 [Strongyloides ratti]CEF60583.1 Hypothetical protein SRAE_X000231850 [Strongyloides ratti]